jgi:hypothetical protein
VRSRGQGCQIPFNLGSGAFSKLSRLGEWSGLDSHYGECKDDADNGEMKCNRRDDDGCVQLARTVPNHSAFRKRNRFADDSFQFQKGAEFFV